MTTDLDEPLIIASVTADATGQPYPLLIDGYALLVTVRSLRGDADGMGNPRDCRMTL
jgi:hypothetical protein